MQEHNIKHFEKLIKLSAELSDVHDLDVLIETILHTAREFVNCDAGSIYIRRGDTLFFSYTQNDTLAGRLERGKKLIYSTFSIPINRNSIAGFVAETADILNIPDAYKIDKSMPYCFNPEFDISANYKTSSMLTVPLKTSRGEVIGVLQLINAKSESGEIISFEKELEPYVMYFAFIAAGALERANLMRTIILRMISMAELRDPTETGNHVNRVAGYSVEIFEELAKKWGLPRAEINRKKDILRMAAMLHDVGKVAISDMILKKPAKLNEDEYEVMKHHTILGARLFRSPSSEFDEAAQEVALNHHERFDGKGYPGHVDTITEEPLPGFADADGKPISKKAEEIPIFGRIVSLADVYDALSSRRSYKAAWDENRVLDEIRNERGKQFDPEVVDAFFNCLPSIKSISARYI